MLAYQSSPLMRVKVVSRSLRGIGELLEIVIRAMLTGILPISEAIVPSGARRGAQGGPARGRDARGPEGTLDSRGRIRGRVMIVAVESRSHEFGTRGRELPLQIASTFRTPGIRRGRGGQQVLTEDVTILTAEVEERHTWKVYHEV